MWDELRILRHVRHPHIVLFHGACIRSDGMLWLVMELVRGLRMDRFLRFWDTKWELSQHEIARESVMRGICQALAYRNEQT